MTDEDLLRRGLLAHTFVWLKRPSLSNQQLLERVDLSLAEIVSAISSVRSIIEIR